MKLFLTKYYLLKKELLPTPIELKTIEALAEKDIPGIFMAQPNAAVPLTQSQTDAIKDGRAQLLENHDYKTDWMSVWQPDFETKQGKLTDLLSGFGWVTVLETGVSVRAHGDIWVWRVRTGEKTIAFKNYDGIEATLPNDIWLLTWEKEGVQPSEQDTSEQIAFNYAEKLEEEKTDKDTFYLLKIDKQLDTEKQVTIPLEDLVIGRRVLAIAKRMIAAKHPFTTYEPLLKSLSAHKVVGKEASDLLGKHAPPIEKPKTASEKPKTAVNNPNSEPTPIYKRPLAIAGFLFLGSVAGFATYLGYKTWGKTVPPHQVDHPKPLDTSHHAQEPSVEPVPNPSPTLEPPPDQTPVRIPPKPSTTTSTQPTQKPPVDPSPNLPPVPSVSLTNVNDLMKKAENNIEQCPKYINDAVNALNAAQKAGLDKTTYNAKAAEIGKLKEKIVKKLKTEAEALISSAENAGNNGKAPVAVRALEAAKTKLELEKQLNDAPKNEAQLKKIEARLKEIEAKIEHWGSKFGQQ